MIGFCLDFKYFILRQRGASILELNTYRSKNATYQSLTKLTMYEISQKEAALLLTNVLVLSLMHLLVQIQLLRNLNGFLEGFRIGNL